MKTTTMPAHRIPRAAAPAPPTRPVVPRPLWEAHRLFQEPQFPEGTDLPDEDEEDEGEPIITA